MFELAVAKKMLEMIELISNFEMFEVWYFKIHKKKDI